MDSDSDCPQETDEFDMDFFENNPSIIRTRKFIQENMSEVKLTKTQDLKADEHCNTTFNNRIVYIQQGLNPNRKGKKVKQLSAEVEDFFVRRDNQLNSRHAKFQKI